MKKTNRRPRVVVAKIGLDGHNRGAYVVAHGLRQAGMEVIYTGLRQTPAAVARAAAQESADVIGISSMVGAHLTIVRKLKNELKALNSPDIPIMVGGIIPEEDYDKLLAEGASLIFPTGTDMARIVQGIEGLLEDPRWVPEVPGSLTGDQLEDLHLQGSKCDACGRIYFPLRKNCPQCMDGKPIRALQLGDKGILQTFVVASVAPPGYDVPHAQGYIDLEGGPCIFSLLTDFGDGSLLKIGDRMVLNIITRGKDPEGKAIMAYRFRPES